MKRIALLLTTVVLSTIGFAQGKYGATPQDSIVCVENLIYKDYMKSDPKLALTLQRKAYNACPASQKTLYTNGVKLYKGLIKKAEDPATKQAYIDTMYSIFDQRIEHFGQACKVKGLKGQTMLVYSKKDPEGAFALLEASLNECGDKTESGTLVGISYAIVNLEKKGVKTSADVIAIYERTMAVVGANKDGKNAEKYKNAEEKINARVAAYLTCETLVPVAEKGFEANQDDVAWLERNMKLLKYKKCYEAEIFVKVTKKYLELSPSSEGYASLGKVELANKNFSGSIDAFKKAIEHAEDNESKAQFHYDLATTYYFSKQYASARTHAVKAAGLKGGWGEPYILIGDAYAASSKSCDDGKAGKYAVYWAAVDKYQKAKSVDGSVAGKANKKIASMTSRYPEAKELFFHSISEGQSYTVGCWINETTTVRTKQN